MSFSRFPSNMPGMDSIRKGFIYNTLTKLFDDAVIFKNKAYADYGKELHIRKGFNSRIFLSSNFCSESLSELYLFTIHRLSQMMNLKLDGRHYLVRKSNKFTKRCHELTRKCAYCILLNIQTGWKLSFRRCYNNWTTNGASYRLFQDKT